MRTTRSPEERNTQGRLEAQQRTAARAATGGCCPSRRPRRFDTLGNGAISAPFVVVGSSALRILASFGFWRSLDFGAVWNCSAVRAQPPFGRSRRSRRSRRLFLRRARNSAQEKARDA